MRKAILVMATSVAFLFSASLVSAAGIKKTVTMPRSSSILNNSTGVSKNGGTLSVRGPLVGEHIPGGPGTAVTPISLLPTIDMSIPGIASKVKSLASIKGGLAGLVGTAALQALLDQIGGLIDESGSVTVKGPDTVDGLPYRGNKLIGSDCASAQNNPVGVYGGPQTFIRISAEVPSAPWQYINNCTSRHVSIRSFPSNPVVPSVPVPATPQNLSGIDGVLPSADPDFIRRVASESCSGAVDVEGCIKSFTNPGSPSLSGPSSVQGPSQTTTTTSPAGTTTSTTTTNWTITYGPDYFIYTPTTTTTTTNPDGSTSTSTTTQTGTQTSEETKTETMPNIPDMFGGMNDQLAGLPPEISGQGASGSSLPYSSWFDMGGSCKEHSFYFGVVGTVTTNYCPIHEQYVRPFLYFIFALWTWHTCFAIWAQRVTMVRAN